MGALKAIHETLMVDWGLKEKTYRARVVTRSGESLEGDVGADSAKGTIFFNVWCDDGREITIPVGSVEYIEDLEPDRAA